MKVAVVDDDKKYRAEIVKLLEPYVEPYGIVTCEFEDGQAFVNVAKEKGQFAIALMDIEMNNVNGIEAIKEIRKLGHETIVIFITNYMSYCSDSLRLDAIQYLKKPVKKEDFDIDIKRAIEKYKRSNSMFSIRWESKIYNVKCKDIVYIETYRHRLKIHTTDEQYDCNGNLRSVYEVLRPVGFIKTSQSYVVNMAYISKIEQTILVLNNNWRLLLSRNERRNVIRMFSCYISGDFVWFT